jgi:hypothetical protein
MPKFATSKSSKTIKSLDDGLHYIGHVPGLCVQVSGDEGRSWVLCYRFARRPREMGLGGLRDVPLADAVEAAQDARKLVRKGIDPLADRKRLEREQITKQRTTITFEAARKRCVASKMPEWKNAKHALQWTYTLETYAAILERLDVREIETSHILQVLEPIWTTKTETASRVQQRIAVVLDWCRAHGYRDKDSENPARWKGHLDKLLPLPSKIAVVEHFAAVPWRDMPSFAQALREQEGVGARAVEFCIYTAARSGPVRVATWDEIDMKTAKWTIPAPHMKSTKGKERDHVVPLSALHLPFPEWNTFVRYDAHRRPSTHERWRNGSRFSLLVQGLGERVHIPRQ